MRPVPVPRPRWTAGRVTAALATLAVVLVVFAGVLPQVAGYGEVAGTLRALSAGGLLLLAALTVAHLGAFGLLLATVVPRLGRRQAVAVHLSSTAVAHTVPAGGAVAVGVQYAGLGVLGHPPGAVTAGLAAAGLWDNVGRLVLVTVAAGLTAVRGDHAAGVVGGIGLVVLLAVLVLVAAALTSDRLLRAVARLLAAPVASVRRRTNRPPMDVPARLAAIRHDLALIARRRWPALTALTLVHHLSLFALLLTCLRVLGVDAATVSAAQVLPVYALARLVTAVPVTPGGVGIVELGYVALLAGDAPADVAVAVTAAVLLFRALSYLLPIPLGVAAWLLLPRLRGMPSRLAGAAVG